MPYIGKFLLILVVFSCLAVNASQAQKKQKYTLRDWVRDSLPAASGALTDLQRMDLIYLKALSLKKGKKGGALFNSMRATMLHRYCPGPFNIPLYKETNENYIERRNKLPSNIFADRPNAGDRDKLAHFFASGWLMWTFQDVLFADALGITVELLQENFQRGNFYDVRDVRANRLGQDFAMKLFENEKTLPSELIQEWNESFKSLKK